MRFAARMILLLMVSCFMSASAYAQYDQSSAVSLPLNGSSSGSMSTGYSNYWWKVTTTVDGALYINTLASTGLEIDNYLYDQNGQRQIASYDFSGSHPEDQTHFNNLTPGTYYIVSNRYSGTGTYTITSRFTATRFENDPEPNDSASVAVPLSLNSSKTGHLGFYGNSNTDIYDWRKITTTVDGSLYINTLSDSTLEIDNYIYDQNKITQIAGYDFGGSRPTDQSHVSNLAAGTYYILTFRYQGYGSYTITSTFTPSKLQNDVEPNDSASVALTLPPNGSMTGHLRYYGNGKTDYEDWYKVTTPSDGALYINTLSDSTLEIDNYIYDQNKKTQIASYDFGGSKITDQAHVSNLAAGTYYVRTTGYQGYGSYSITSTFTATKLQNDAEPNDSSLVALTLPLNTSLTGHLGYYGEGKTDYEDWWKITTTVDGLLYINTVSDSTLEIDNYFYDQNGKTQIASYDFGGTNINDQVHFSNLGPGTYYVRTTRYAGWGSYTVKCSFTATRFTPDTEPNSTLAAATAITTGSTRYGHLGFYTSGVTDTQDYFSFTVPAGWDSLFVRVLSDSSLEADADLYNSAGNSILHNGVNGVNTVMVYTKPPAGQYFLDIYRYSGSGAYAFIVTNTWQAAINIPTSTELMPPTNVAVTDIPNDQGHRLKLTWTASASESSGTVAWYRILRSRSSVLTTPVSIKKFATIDSLNFWEKTTTVLVDSVTAGVKEYTDQGVPLNGVTYYYWLQAVGKTGASRPVPAGFATAVEDLAPLAFSVSDPYPNPFNPTVTIRYQLPESVLVRLTVFDILGRKVAVPDEGLKSAGVHETVWNAGSGSGAALGSGMYFWRLEAGSHTAQGKMMLLR